ncbi:hypothetical protein, partial [Paenibacillus odorifer]|uniref:hypothetical protein n=1 Tax=Paenibacillus odorifer TaxID=189426 RepID=UPI001C4AA950
PPKYLRRSDGVLQFTVQYLRGQMASLQFTVQYLRGQMVRTQEPLFRKIRAFRSAIRLRCSYSTQYA